MSSIITLRGAILLFIFIMLISAAGVALIAFLERRESRVRELKLVENTNTYNNKRKEALRWLGNKYLLAEPINRDHGYFIMRDSK